MQNDYAVIVGDTIALREPHPVASYFVLKPWLALACDSEFALRFLGVWWGLLAVARFIAWRGGSLFVPGPQRWRHSCWR